MKKPPGYVLYEGPSEIDGAPIVVIINKIHSKSKNIKTGSAIQTWIMRSDMPPLEALQSGHDASVCGSCPARNTFCYVQVGREVSSVWKAYQRGSYAPWEPAKHLKLLTDRYLRVGSYGDPAAAPLATWEPLLAACTMHTAYTHQWRDLGVDDWGWCMASCDSQTEHYAAKRAGWRTFLIQLPEDKRLKGVASCPASKEQGFKLTCADCGHCGGHYDRGASRIGDVSIIAHGNSQKRYVQWRQLEIELETAPAEGSVA